MALATRFEQLIREEVVKDQADLALLAQIIRARETQIMDLLLLAPQIQEEILFLPSPEGTLFETMLAFFGVADLTQPAFAS